MSQAPSMPMYWDAYLADTTHLTCEEHGAYLLLLAAMWRRNGSVPDEDRDIGRILGLTPGRWRKIKVRLAPLLIIEGGSITQKKLRETWEKTQENIAKNRANGALGGRPKSNDNKGVNKANGSNSVNPKKTIPEPEPEPEERDKSLSPAPEAREPDPFDAFYAAYPRKEGKAPARKAYRTALKSTDAETILRHATAYAKARAAEIAAGKSEARFTKHPATWLNAKPWEDAPPPSKPVPTFNFRGGAEYDDETLRARDAMREQLARRRPLPEAMGGSA